MKKNSILSLSIIVLLLSFLCAFSIGIEGQAKAEEYMKVNCKAGANVRSGPSTKDSIVDCLSYGTTVMVINEKDGWSSVEYSSKSGYIKSTLLSPVPSTISSEGGSLNMEVACNSGVNVRSGPGTNYPIIGGLDKGIVVTTTAIENNWFKIDLNGKTGYAHMQNFVETTKPASDLSAFSGATPDKGFTPKVMTVNCKRGVNVRSSANENASIIGGLEKGQTINVIGTEGNWWKVDYNNRPAYIYKTWLS